MNDEELQALKLNFKKSVETIFVDDVIPALYEKGILKSYDTIERIQSEKTTTDKACKLMHRVMKCDKPSTFRDFVEIIKEYYEFLAEDLNRTVTHVRRQKRCLTKRSPQQPQRRLAATEDSLDEVFTTPRMGPSTLPVKQRSPKPACHRCRRRVRSEISSEAGLPGLCLYGRYNKDSSYSSQRDSQLSQSSSDDETPVKGFDVAESQSEATLCNGLGYQSSLHHMTETAVKQPFRSNNVNDGKEVNASETVLKETISSQLLMPTTRQAEENTDMHGLSVNYGEIDGFNIRQTETQNSWSHGVDSHSCKCSNIFNTRQPQPIFEEKIRLVPYSSSEVGEDVPDFCTLDRDTVEDVATDSVLTTSSHSTSNIDAMPSGKHDADEICSQHTDKENTAKYNDHEASHLDNSPGDIKCLLRKRAQNRFRERNAVMFNVSQDESTMDKSKETQESYQRYVTLSRETYDVSFGFRYVSGEKRPRFKDDSDYYISEILPDSLASESSDLRVMHTIELVNGQSLQEKSLDDIQKLFESCLTVALTLKPEPNSSRDVNSYLA